MGDLVCDKGYEVFPAGLHFYKIYHEMADKDADRQYPVVPQTQENIGQHGLDHTVYCQCRQFFLKIVSILASAHLIRLEHEIPDKVRRDKFQEQGGHHSSFVFFITSSSNLARYALISSSLDNRNDLSTVWRETPNSAAIL